MELRERKPGTHAHYSRIDAKIQALPCVIFYLRSLVTVSR